MATTTAPRPQHVDEPSVEVSDDRLGRLRRFNLVMGSVHLMSGGAMIVLGNDFTLPVSTLDQGGPPGTPLSERGLSLAFDLRLA